LRQKVKGNEDLSTENFEAFYLQEPNKKLPIVPFSMYVWLYHWGENVYNPNKYEEKKQDAVDKYDALIAKNSDKPKKVEKLKKKKTKKTNKYDKALREGNQLMRWGEPVAVFDSTLAQRTAMSMELYLESKGYYEGDVELQTEQSNRTITVRYEITEGRPILIDTLFYFSTDTVLKSYIVDNPKDILLKKGQNLDQTRLENERERIEKFLKNKGYYTFSRQYVEYDIDTAWNPYGSAIRVRLLSPVNSSAHKKFKIDSVIWITDAQYKFSNLERESEFYNNVEYKYFDKHYSKKLLDKRLFIYPDSSYSLGNTLNTQRQLANMDIFKYINVAYDSTGGDFVANIYTSPLKKSDLSIEGGLNVTEGIPGPFINSAYRIRNIFGGLEIFEISGRFGFDGIGTAIRDVDFTFNDFLENPRQFWNLDARLDLSLTIPQFLIPFGNKFEQKLGKIDPKTTFRAGYSITDRQNEYTRRIFSFNANYLWENQRGDLYNFSPFSLSFNNTDTTPEFQALLEELEAQGNNLIRSFDKSIVSSILFTGIMNVRNYQAPTSEQKLPFYIRYIFESGGTFQNFYNINLEEFTTFQFLRTDIDVRKFLNKNRNVVFKSRVGIAYPYANNFADFGRVTDPESITLPFEKFFFIGGSNSVRAWRPRRLGPGSTKLPLDENGLQDYSFERPGEFLFEASLEFRAKLFGFVYGAVFFDAGNIWSLRTEDAGDLGGSSKLSFRQGKFFRELALGTGVGIRFDFSFLLLRLDMGIQVMDPSRDPGERFVLGLLRFDSKTSIGRDFAENRDNWVAPTVPSFNLGVGFPF